MREIRFAYANSKSGIFEELAIRTNKIIRLLNLRQLLGEGFKNFERAFHGHINNFASYLKMHGIKREIPTIKNWFVDSVVIAPQVLKRT